MRLIVDDEGVRLTEPDNFRQLSVAMPDHLRGSDLRGLGLDWYDVDHVWIAGNLIPGLAADEADKSWQAAFADMLSFASRHGWVDGAGRIRAHVE